MVVVAGCLALSSCATSNYFDLVKFGPRDVCVISDPTVGDRFRGALTKQLLRVRLGVYTMPPSSKTGGCPQVLTYAVDWIQGPNSRIAQAQMIVERGGDEAKQHIRQLAERAEETSTPRLPSWYPS